MVVYMRCSCQIFVVVTLALCGPLIMMIMLLMMVTVAAATTTTMMIIIIGEKN